MNRKIKLIATTQWTLLILASCAKPYKDVSFNPSKCLIHLDTISYFENISLSYKHELLFNAIPKNKTIRDFCPCAPDTTNFRISKEGQLKTLDISKIPFDSVYIFISAVRKNDPHNISADYTIQMSKIKDKTQMYYPDGIWMR